LPACASHLLRSAKWFHFNVARLSPRRAYAAGFLRAKQQARKQMHAITREWETELALLQDEFRELAVEHHCQSYDAAVDEALGERSARPDMLLN